MPTHQRPFDAELASLPPEVELVWHGVNDAANLRQFLASAAPWCELDVNLDPDGEDLILRHDSYAELARWPGEQPLHLRDVLPPLVAAGKSIKLDFKIGGRWIDVALDLVDELDLPQDRLWLNADLDVFGESVISALSSRYPNAIRQVPLHSLSARLDAPRELFREIERVAALGINRFSVGWRYPNMGEIVARLKQDGYEANIYGVANLKEFLQAVDMRPSSVTADFNFPEWRYYGRGSGHGGSFHTYSIVC